ncbi:hypothetical protein ACQBAT_09680 [Ornithinimicrobium sp. Y1847]|uniref:hypothetical protein n=1 Tax=Ornithinimicrobium sp. Y1847 TaxID=3405419 RepID=UPI003B67DD59
MPLNKVRQLRRKGSYWHLHRYEFDLDSPAVQQILDASARGGGPGPALVEVNLPDLDAMRASSKELTERKYEQLKERIGARDITAYLIRTAEGEWAGYCHLAFNRFDDRYLSHVVRLHKDQAFFVDDQVFKPFRRRGLHLHSIGRRCELARKGGLRTGVVVLNDKNTASRAAYSHVGIRPVRKLTLVRPFKVMIQTPILGRR